ncbi:MAG TPA: hypothetical protein EYQ25_06515 [Planctomycetes bacterium]|nr:hypothetical protein [Planctomycetota bacterium]HIL37362.1 hypothetical protein [Planctomycetota bacterium]
MFKGQLTIHYHRDFDGMVAGAVLASILSERDEEDIVLKSVNYDQRKNWESFSKDERFAIVDFHFHPQASYWFDHHPTTFLTPELREQYKPDERWMWDPESPSCPPMILAHAKKYWGYEPSERFIEMAQWSDIIDAARYESVDQAIYGDTPALRIARALTASPSQKWPDEIASAMMDETLEEVAERADVEQAHQRASSNRDKALLHFPPTVIWNKDGVLLYDASSNRIRRERFAAYYHHPDISYAVGVIPTRAGFHVTCGENPWNQPTNRANVGELMERYGGGGHIAVGGANPPNLDETRRVAEEVANILVKHLQD